MVHLGYEEEQLIQFLGIGAISKRLSIPHVSIHLPHYLLKPLRLLLNEPLLPLEINVSLLHLLLLVLYFLPLKHHLAALLSQLLLHLSHLLLLLLQLCDLLLVLIEGLLQTRFLGFDALVFLSELESNELDVLVLLLLVGSEHQRRRYYFGVVRVCQQDVIALDLVLEHLRRAV